jgi:NSS family neurotransmitter:Na+ symporter
MGYSELEQTGMASSTCVHGMWSSRFAFILAASGSAVGLGNIWRFPYTAGEYGGGAFVAVYLLCVAVIGIPIMMAEVMLGRRGRQSPINSMRALAAAQQASRFWQLVGWLGLVSGFLILSFYSVVAGWTLAYTLSAGLGNFTAIDAAAAGEVFADLVGDPWRLLLWHSVFMGMVALVVARGVTAGLELAVRLLMPALFALLLLMVAYAATQSGAFAEGLVYLFKPDFAEFQGRAGEAILSAMGQAFFSLSLGMGAIMMYGSYLSSEASITENVVVIAGMDTLVALLAGMAIFPIVLAHGLEPGSGPGLIFQTLPIAFGQMPGGQFFAVLFFVLLLFAAWTSAISLLEPLTAWLVENHGWRRPLAAVSGAAMVWLLGILCLLSLNVWSEVKILGKGFFDLFDYVTSNIMLPLGGVLIAIFAGWVLKRELSARELMGGDNLGYRSWRFLIRYVAPVGVAIVFLNAIGLI